MGELFKTSIENKHYHIVYLRDDGFGMTSTNQGHSHMVVFIPPQDPILDINGIEIQPGTPGSINIEIAEGHIHTSEPYEVVEREEKKEDIDKVLKTLTMYNESRKLEYDSRSKGLESEEFYCNKQWEPEQISNLNNQDRAAITINQIAPKIDNLSGYQRQNRTDIKYLPAEDGDSRVADMLNAVVKNITEQCYYQREKTKAFEDAAIVGRGILNMFDDFSEEIQGKIIIERFKWDECYFGPHEKEDLSDCEYIVFEKWHSEDNIKAEYPEEWEELSPEVKLKDKRYKLISEDWDTRLRSDEFIDETAKKYKVLTCMFKKFNRSFILANEEDGFVHDATGWRKRDIASVKTIPGFYKIPRVTHKIHVYKTCTYVLLDDYEHDESDFPTIPIYAKFRNNQFYGKVEEVKDLQRLLNKAYSQFIDIISKVANYGWFYDDETFPDRDEEDNWVNNSARPGFNQRITDINRKPEKVEGVKFPNEIVGAMQNLNQTLREVMNVNLESLGLSGGEQSGVAMRQKVIQQLLGNDYLFDNLSFAEKKIGRMLVAKIQKLYTVDRIYRILRNQNNREPFEVAGEPFDSYTEDDVLYLLKTQNLSKYDVDITESPNAPSVMMGNFMMLLELAGKGVPIPPEAVLEFAPLPNKKKILESIAQQKERELEMEQGKQQTEITKSLIANQGQTIPGQT